LRNPEGNTAEQAIHLKLCPSLACVREQHSQFNSSVFTCQILCWHREWRYWGADFGSRSMCGEVCVNQLGFGSSIGVCQLQNVLPVLQMQGFLC